MRLAERYARSPAPAIVITHGVSGCGKTTLSQALLEQVGAVRIRTDVERKRLHGLAPTARSDAAAAKALYSADATRRTYDHVFDLAAGVAGAGLVVIVDGTFLRRWQRDRFRALAAELGVPFVVVAFAATEATLRRRVAGRARLGTDASDADLGVLEHQLSRRQALGADEMADAVTYDAEAPLDVARSPHAWRAVLDRLARAVLGTAGVAISSWRGGRNRIRTGVPQIRLARPPAHRFGTTSRRNRVQACAGSHRRLAAVGALGAGRDCSSRKRCPRA